MDEFQGQADGQKAHAFGETTDPSLYVPRPAADAAIAGLLAGLDRAGGVAALVGPPGIGKTLLLGRAADRLRVRERARRGIAIDTVALPYSSLSMSDWCEWVLGLLGHQTRDGSRDVEARLWERIDRHRQSGPHLLVTMDEAGGLPPETARRLARLVAKADGGLRILLAATEDARAIRVLSSFGDVVSTVRFTVALDARETAIYLHERLRATGADIETARRFDDDAVHWIHRLSGGVPRRIHDVARSLLEAAPGDLGRRWWEDHWLGSPIDDLDMELTGPPKPPRD